MQIVIHGCFYKFLVYILKDDVNSKLTYEVHGIFIKGLHNRDTIYICIFYKNLK